jgi:CheY-like chemotaxis protein
MVTNDTGDARKLVVLCVDDEPDGLFTRAHILEKFGYAVIALTHPLLALEIANDRTIDAALVDYQMPQMNGAMLSAGIRKKAPKVKIIMLSGYTNIPEADLACVDCFVPKCDCMPRILKVLSSLSVIDRDLNSQENQASRRRRTKALATLTSERAAQNDRKAEPL